MLWHLLSCTAGRPPVGPCCGPIPRAGCVVTGPAPIAWAPTAVASVLMAMVYVTGPISGGNLNPAVSLALAISGKLAWLQMPRAYLNLLKIS